MPRGTAWQGNRDQTEVGTGWDATGPAVHVGLRRGGGMGHIFNLGHGVLPETDPTVLERVVETVHAHGPIGTNTSGTNTEGTNS